MSFKDARTLNELVKRDRMLAGLTQEQLARNLNKATDLPIDPFTQKHKIAHGTWISKLENGKLDRELTFQVRQWLATTLGGDISLYKNLLFTSMSKSKTSFDSDLDVLPLMKFIVSSGKTKVTLNEFYCFCKASQYCSKVGVSLVDPLNLETK